MADDLSLAELAEQFFQQWGDRPSLWYDGRWWRSGELRDRAMRWATGLRDRCGVLTGDRVVVMMANSPEVGIAYQALWRINAVVTPVVFLLAGAELAHVLHDSGAVAVVTSPEFQATVVAAAEGSDVRTVIVVGAKDLPEAADTGPRLMAADVLEECSPEGSIEPRRGADLAALLYTGGTTGRAKGVMLTHTGMVAAGRAGAEASYVPGANRSLIPLPLSHAYGLLLTCIGLAAREPTEVVLMRWFDPQGFLQLAQDHRVDRAAVVPSMLAMLLNQRIENSDLSTLTIISSGGAPLAPRLRESFEERVPGARIVEGYGMTETSGLTTTSNPENRRVGTVGRAAPGYEVRIADPSGDAVPAGTPGEVQVRGDGIMAGYWHDVEATEAALRGGWLRTGDIGVLDADGYLRIVDRLKDLIIRGGFNIYPRDIEDALLEHPLVAMAAVVGRPDDIYGEEVVGFVSLTPGSSITGSELVAWARTRIAANKYPREIVVVDTVPLTSVGKLDRKTLRARLSQS